MKVKCSCPECTREFDAPEGHYFCSIECAVYAQKFSVKSGFVLNKQICTYCLEDSDPNPEEICHTCNFGKLVPVDLFLKNFNRQGLLEERNWWAFSSPAGLEVSPELYEIRLKNMDKILSSAK